MIIKNFKTLILLISSASVIFLTSCYQHFPLDQDISRTQNQFLNQNSVKVEFPNFIKGKITLMAMVYTHCPDICPMTTNNMYLVQERLPKDLLNKVRFVIISFDPNRDTPSVLKKFAELRDLDFNYWTFLTGDRQDTKDVMLKFDIKAIPADSTYDKNGELSYSMIHTDRISLIDQDGKLRNNYKGSTVDFNTIINDIKYLGE